MTKREITFHELDNEIWIQAPYTAILNSILRPIPGCSYEQRMRMWVIPRTALKRAVLGMYEHDEVREQSWPFESPSEDLVKEMFSIVGFHTEQESLRKGDWKTVTIPEHLHWKEYKLRGYQYLLAKWMLAVKRGLVCLDMGMGKTLSTITFFKLLHEIKPDARILVVCPAGLKFATWLEEFKKFSDYTVEVIDGSITTRSEQYKRIGETGSGNGRSRRSKHSNNKQFHSSRSGMVGWGSDPTGDSSNDTSTIPMGVPTQWWATIINYDLLNPDANTLNRLVQGGLWDVIIADEATYLKNSKSKRSRIFKSLAKQIKYCFLLTGTPLENDLMETYNLCSIIDNTILGRLSDFRYQHIVEDYNGNQIKRRGRNLKKLYDKLQPIMFRKTKEEVADELPEKIFVNEYVELTDQQKSSYNKIRSEILLYLDDKEDTEKPYLLAQELIVKMIRLQQVVDGLSLIGIKEESNPKIDRLAELLDNDLAGKKVIIFTQFRDMVTKIVEAIGKERCVCITGSVDSKQRAISVNSFQNDPTIDVMVMTTAGGMGLNLTAASVVILIDLLWNPKLIDQIIDRAHRIGSKHVNILIIYLLALGSLEIRKIDVLKDKSNLFKAVIEGNEQALTDYNDNTVKVMLKQIKEILCDKY